MLLLFGNVLYHTWYLAISVLVAAWTVRAIANQNIALGLHYFYVDRQEPLERKSDPSPEIRRVLGTELKHVL